MRFWDGHPDKYANFSFYSVVTSLLISQTFPSRIACYFCLLSFLHRALTLCGLDFECDNLINMLVSFSSIVSVIIISFFINFSVQHFSLRIASNFRLFSLLYHDPDNVMDFETMYLIIMHIGYRDSSNTLIILSQGRPLFKFSRLIFLYHYGKKTWIIIHRYISAGSQYFSLDSKHF